MVEDGLPPDDGREEVVGLADGGVDEGDGEKEDGPAEGCVFEAEDPAKEGGKEVELDLDFEGPGDGEDGVEGSVVNEGVGVDESGEIAGKHL